MFKLHSHLQRLPATMFAAQADKGEPGAEGEPLGVGFGALPRTYLPRVVHRKHAVGVENVEIARLSGRMEGRGVARKKYAAQS